MRLVLLATIACDRQLTAPVFTAFGHGFSWRDLILIAGGLFLVWKATKEIHHTVDPDDHKDDARQPRRQRLARRARSSRSCCSTSSSRSTPSSPPSA